MNKLRTSMGVFVINTVCTLKCKKCITLTPYQKHPTNFPLENICQDIHDFFEIFEWVEHFDIEGGESLLHPDLPQIIEKGFEYKEHFGRFHILTNGTIVPNEELIGICRKHSEIFFIIDDYGPNLSRNIPQITKIFEENNISYRIDKYYGEEQYCGGWIDVGDLTYKNYTPGELKCVFENCRAAHCGAPYIKNRRLFTCFVQAAGVKHIELDENEYVDFEDERTLEERIAIAAKFGEKPIKACSHCKGFNAEYGERYAAAEQITSLSEEEKICL